MQTQRGSILVVDDTPTNLKVLSEFLADAGFEVLVATDGESALQQISYALPHIILLDVMMPGIDGFETCQRLKANPMTQDIPVIFMTALTDTVDKVHGFEVGAADYITKPLQHQEVLARVKAHLTLYQQRLEIERLHEQERQYYERLMQMKDDILHTASHDLKNPISAIYMTLYMLEKHLPPEDEKGHEYIQNMQGDVNRMHNLIVQVLDLAALESGEAMQAEPLQVRYLMEENFSNFGSVGKQRQLALRLTLPEQDVTIHGDLARLSQVLQNLMSNAVKYTPDGGEIELGAQVDGQQVCIWVRDTGLGIPARDIPHLFEKFYRVKAVSHQQIEGTGLGLSIVKAIVEQHGGSLDVKSAPGMGSTFSVKLPLAAPPP